jgi:hypothetical protein
LIGPSGVEEIIPNPIPILKMNPKKSKYSMEDFI